MLKFQLNKIHFVIRKEWIYVNDCKYVSRIVARFVNDNDAASYILLS